jgi:uncharacterized protein (TIGR02996 family)
VTERDAFPAAIREDPADDTPRLVFADWLDENGRDDLDAATAEFIRVSCRCGTKPGRAMPSAAYSWIDKNFKRLVPTLFEKYPTFYDGAPTGYWGAWLRDGCNVNLKWRPHLGCVPGWYSVWLAFTRGFLEDATIWSVVAERALYPVLAADQPLLKVPAYLTPRAFQTPPGVPT